MENIVTIEKVVLGGQGLGTLPNGKKVFVWGALPKEKVLLRIYKTKSSYAEAITDEVLKESRDRITPEGPEEYVSTSPWQIMNFEAENNTKFRLLCEAFTSAHLNIKWENFFSDKKRYGYRNKMEYNFWWDNETQRVSLALHRRGSHQKFMLDGSVLASDAINNAGRRLIEYMNNQKIEARSLKSVILRSQKDGGVGVVLYAVNRDLSSFDWGSLNFESFTLYYSEPKSPASVGTELLASYGKKYLEDEILSKQFRYSPEGFFQVNLSAYEVALNDMRSWVKTPEVIDMYAGVGSIGMSMPYRHLISVELDSAANIQALVNAKNNKNIQVILSESERALQYINGEATLIVDPPRAGLHRKVIAKITDVSPPLIAYLSCDPATQARDVAIILETGKYEVKFARGYNFFPATPHIESLIILKLK